MEALEYHYPPELFDLLVDTVPLLFRSKPGVITFFRGAGVHLRHLEDLQTKVRSEPGSVSKYQIARTVLTSLNEEGERGLRQRREVIKRVIEFEAFDTCWPEDRYKAEALVGRIRQVVDAKDSFMRMKAERDSERVARIAAYQVTLDDERRKTKDISNVYRELCALFSVADPHERGVALEGVLHRAFAVYGIAVREVFTVNTDEGVGIGEQVDGAIELDGQLYLVEAKWHAKPLGVDKVSRHVMRVLSRGGGARGLLVSYSRYTDPAIDQCRQALAMGATLVLADVEELVRLLERQGDLVGWLRDKVQAAVLDKKPYQRIIVT